MVRNYGPALAIYLFATAFTAPHFWGDSIDYAIEIRGGMLYWEFGHLFWRPLGTLLRDLAAPWASDRATCPMRVGPNAASLGCNPVAF